MNINLKMPKLKFGKIKMDTVEDLENVEIDYEKIKENQKQKEQSHMKQQIIKLLKNFYKVNKWICRKALYIRKPDHKEPYKTFTYKEFGDDVIALGTAMIKLLNLKDKE